MRTIRLLVVDDETMVRQGLAGLLALEPDMEVVGMASNGAAALEMSAKTNPDVVLMDIQMPVLNGIEATARLLEQQPAVRVLVLTTFDQDELVVQALKSGAHGYLLKDCGSKQLAAAVRSIVQGFMTLGKHAAKTVIENAIISETGNDDLSRMQLSKLTTREREVLACLGAGLSNAEIAEQLSVTEKTIRDHVSNILGELSLRDRTQAALWAREHNC